MKARAAGSVSILFGCGSEGSSPPFLSCFPSLSLRPPLPHPTNVNHLEKNSVQSLLLVTEPRVELVPLSCLWLWLWTSVWHRQGLFLQVERPADYCILRPSGAAQDFLGACFPWGCSGHLPSGSWFDLTEARWWKRLGYLALLQRLWALWF